MAVVWGTHVGHCPLYKCTTSRDGPATIGSVRMLYCAEVHCEAKLKRSPVTAARILSSQGGFRFTSLAHTRTAQKEVVEAIIPASHRCLPDANVVLRCHRSLSSSRYRGFVRRNGNPEISNLHPQKVGRSTPHLSCQSLAPHTDPERKTAFSSYSGVRGVAARRTEEAGKKAKTKTMSASICLRQSCSTLKASTNFPVQTSNV